MHAYFRGAKDLKLGLSLGVGIDQNTKVKFLPCISLLIGRRDRFIINGGAAIGKQNDLSAVQDINYLNKNAITPAYTESIVVGWHLGISYNLTSVK